MTDDDRPTAPAADSASPNGTSVDGKAAPVPEGADNTTEPLDLERTGTQRAVAPPQREDGPPAAPRWATPRRQAGRPAPAPAAPTPSSSGPPPSAPSETAPAGGRKWLLIAALIIGLVAGLVGGYGGAKLADGQGESDVPANANSNVGQVAASALPGVVTLKVRGGDRSGSGSGFVIREDGYILTNNHVASVAGDDGTLTAVFSDGSEMSAKVVGQDASYDLAVVKVEKSGLKPLSFGKSDSVHVGDPVIAVGAPLGLESTVTTGIVSALDRPVVAGQSQDQASYINAIQTDAAINPGNSGGPLLDSQGRVIGINTAIARVPGSSSSGGSQGNIGLGFSIPADTAKRTSEQLIKTGKAEHPAIGARLDLRYTGEGAKVAGNGDDPAVTPDGPADKAGIKEGDIILRIDGRRVTNANMLIVTTRSKAVGETVKLLVRSGDSERTVDVVLATADDDDDD